jgi:hypothetical protein
VEAPLADNVPGVPAQMVIGLESIVGIGFTVIVTVAVAVHPFTEVPVTVYVVVAAGLPVTVAPVVVLKPVAGAHE